MDEDLNQRVKRDLIKSLVLALLSLSLSAGILYSIW